MMAARANWQAEDDQREAYDAVAEASWRAGKAAEFLLSAMHIWRHVRLRVPDDEPSEEVTRAMEAVKDDGADVAADLRFRAERAAYTDATRRRMIFAATRLRCDEEGFHLPDIALLGSLS